MGILEIVALLVIFLAVLYLPGWWVRNKRKAEKPEPPESVTQMPDTRERT